MSGDDDRPPQASSLPGPVSGLLAWTPCPGCGSHDMDVLKADGSEERRVGLIHDITCPVVRQRFQVSWPAEQPDLEGMSELELSALALHLSNVNLVAVENEIATEQLDVTGLRDRIEGLMRMWRVLELDLDAAVKEDYRRREAAEIQEMIRERQAAVDHDR